VTNAPAVSVLMSVYNGERWLRESIRSILTQSYPDFEFLIIDDGSRDRSLEILRECASQDGRITVHEKANTGLADSLNVGLSHARGRWIARTDADDISEPDRLMRQLRHLQAHEHVVLLGTGLRLIHADGEPAASHQYPEDHTALVRRLTHGGPRFAHASVMFRRDAALSIGGYRPRVRTAEDLDLWLRLAEIGPIGCLRDPLVRIRKHVHQVSREDGGARQFVDAYLAMTSYWIRRSGGADPVASASGAAFERFRTWLTQRLAEERVLQRHAVIEHTKSELATARDVREKLHVALRTTRTHPELIRRWMVERTCGAMLPRRLAGEWIATAAALPP
jgi:glycosyltransferase involved in cell wall biosynthesis